MNLVFVFAILALAAGMAGGGLLVSRALAPRVPGETKAAPYECGETPIGAGQVQFNVAYYLFALLFLVFDVEALFLFPWAVAIRELGASGFAAITVFVAVLLAGLAYAWKKGALEWKT